MEIVRTFASDLKHILDWIDQNPEYLLVILSDHGGDWPTDNVLSSHGPAGGGNEAFVVFYNPKYIHL